MIGPGLSYRQPERRWMVISAVAALCLHGLSWFAASMLIHSPDTAGEVQRQVMLALFWMIGVLIIWKISPPASRLHAVMIILLCALLVGVFGSIIVEFKNKYTADGMPRYIYFAILILRHVCLAVPSAILLQAVALRRQPV